MVEGALNEVVVTAQVGNGKDLTKTLYVDFSRAETPATAAEQRRYEENQRLLAELRAHMTAVRENRTKKVVVSSELTTSEIQGMRSYCDAVENPDATRVIDVQRKRCREFRLDYPEDRYPVQ